MHPDLPPTDVEAEYRTRLHTYQVPAHLHEGLVAYFVYHRPPGSFLRAVLENDLRHAVQRADPASLAGLSHVVAFVCDATPAASWGAPASVRTWLAHGVC